MVKDFLLEAENYLHSAGQKILCLYGPQPHITLLTNTYLLTAFHPQVGEFNPHLHTIFVQPIHLVMSYDRSKASSKASSPHSAIQSFLFQMRVSSPFLKVIQ